MGEGRVLRQDSNQLVVLLPAVQHLQHADQLDIHDLAARDRLAEDQDIERVAVTDKPFGPGRGAP